MMNCFAQHALERLRILDFPGLDAIGRSDRGLIGTIEIDVVIAGVVSAYWLALIQPKFEFENTMYVIGARARHTVSSSPQVKPKDPSPIIATILLEGLPNQAPSAADSE